MTDILEYFALQDEVKELKIKLERCIRQKSRYKRLWEGLNKKEPKHVSRCEKARKMIATRHSGQSKITLVEIAKVNFLSYSTVKALARDMRKKDVPT